MVFFLSGFISVLCQTILLREMLVVFSGNELTIGLMFSNWLIGVALGAFAANKYLSNTRLEERKLLIASFYLLAVLFLGEFVFVRNIRLLFNVFPGSAIGLARTYYYSLLVFVPVSFVAGAQFSLGTRYVEKTEALFPSMKVYIAESLGYLAGGVVFTFFLTSFINPSGTVLVVSILCLAAVVNLLKTKNLKAAVAAFAVMFAISMPYVANRLEQSTLTSLYHGFENINVSNSHYGQVAVVSNGEEKFINLDGVVIRSLPDVDTASQEGLAGFAYLYTKNPENALVIGGAGKYAETLSSFGLKSIDVVEQDPSVLSIIKNNPHSPSVNIVLSDPRDFLVNNDKIYDLILIGVPYPVTLSMNRFFTVEFFTLVKARLSRDGILALKTPGSLVYVERHLSGIIRVLKNSLIAVFPYVKLLPGDETIFVCSQSPLPATNILLNRFESVKTKTKFLTGQYIQYITDEGKAIWLNSHINRGILGQNRDFDPVLLTYTLSYWQSMFSGASRNIYEILSKFSWLMCLPLIVWVLSDKMGTAGTSFSTGASMMGLEMVFVFLLQALKGNLYYWIGFLTAIFMAGIVAGGFFEKHLRPLPALLGVRIAEFAVFSWCTILYLLFKFKLIAWAMLFPYAFISGALLGLEFGILVSFDMLGKEISDSSSGNRIYMYDVLGGWVSAVVGGLLILPLWGVEKTLIFICFIKIISARYWFFFKSGSN